VSEAIAEASTRKKSGHFPPALLKKPIQEEKFVKANLSMAESAEEAENKTRKLECSLFLRKRPENHSKRTGGSQASKIRTKV